MQKFKIFGSVGLLLILFSNAMALADEPALLIKSGTMVKKFTRTQLLKESKPIEVSADPSYPGMKNIYQAVPAKDLFKGIVFSKDATLLFSCLDGFSAPISLERLLNQPKDGATPYIAIEPPQNRWPILKDKDVSAGPFYLVWINPEQSKIGPEEWPYQLAGFEVKESIESQFPGILPDSKLGDRHVVRKGLQVFLKNCFACHTLNGEGTAQMGPDLNLPNNPTEYLKEEYLQKLIRNPQSLRQWPQSKMSAFPESIISNSELSDLISYLKHMSTRKKK